MNIRNIAYFFITVIAIVVILISGKSLLIPFIFAFLLWFIIREVRVLLEKVDFIKTKFPSWTKNLLTSLLILGALTFSSKVITTSINSLAQSYPKYEKNIESIVSRVNENLNIDIVDYLKGHTSDLNFGAILKSIFQSVTDILGSAFMIIIYGLFIFLEESSFHLKIRNVFPDKQQFDKVSTVLDRMERSIAKYLGLKTLVSLITGILSYLVLLIIGIDSPAFWAFLIFILNYIPTIGSLIGTTFPAFFCLLQFGDFTQGALVLVFVGTVQVIVGNVLEPKLMGNSMNLSALVTIIALSFWGAIWGVTGMILSIPITVIMLIIFSQFPSTKPVAIMLSDKGEVG